MARSFLPMGPLSPTPIVLGFGGLSLFLPWRRTCKDVKLQSKSKSALFSTSGKMADLSVAGRDEDSSL